MTTAGGEHAAGGEPAAYRVEWETLRRAARAMLERLSRVVPLVDDGGVWRVASTERTPSDG